MFSRHLTLSQLGAGQIMPTTLKIAPYPGFSDLPTALPSPVNEHVTACLFNDVRYVLVQVIRHKIDLYFAN